MTTRFVRPRALHPLLALLVALAACSEKPSERPGLDARGGGERPHSPELGSVEHAAVSDGAGPSEHGAGDRSSSTDGKSKPSSELVLFKSTGMQFTTSDNGFKYIIKPGDTLPKSNWKSPLDYYNGQLHIRYVIGSPASQKAGMFQICFWTIGNADGDGKDWFPESCSAYKAFTGVGTFTNTDVVPSAWWKNDSTDLDFSHPERFEVGIVLLGTSGCNVTTYSGSNNCWSEWPNYQSMTFGLTIVMDAKGDTFSGWSNY
jgi:hypothetical protein